eukprot:COSAG05_NODE_11690_length_501_cov_2.577114_2_plen_31_part_01
MEPSEPSESASGGTDPNEIGPGLKPKRGRPK